MTNPALHHCDRLKSRSLVIGGNGFIGSHLVDALVRAGDDVTVFDRFRGDKHAFSSSDVRIVQGDFLDRDVVSRAVEGQDKVFHFLSATSPATAEDDPTLDIRTNVAQSVELFAICSKLGIGHLYFASTGGAIYGDQGLKRYSEDSLTKPVSPYGIGKLTLEHYLEYFRVTAGLDSTVLRISNPYGSRQKSGRKQGLIPIVLDRIARDLPIVVYGDGSMVRDYVLVDDLVQMVVTISRANSLHHTYNLGSGEGKSVNEVLSILETVSGKEFERLQRPAPLTFVKSVVLDTSRFQAEFALTGMTSLQSGISRTWKEGLETNKNS